eukprot:g6175.t1
MAMMNVVLLFGLVSGDMRGFRRAMTQVDYCEPLDFPTPAIDNCISCPACSSSTGCTADCQTCAERYYLNTAANPDVCSSCIANCMKCRDATTCTRCARGMFFQEAECKGSIANCGSQAPDVFQPVITGGLNLIGGTNIEIQATFSNYFYNVSMNYLTCTATTLGARVKVSTPGQELCQGTYTATADYLNDCDFTLQDNGDTYIFRGTLVMEVNYDIYFLGVAMAEPGYLKRPVGWKLTLNKLLTAEVAMTIKNDDQCEGAVANVFGTKSTSVICHGSGCGESTGTDAVTGTTYLVCQCDACHTGTGCETDICAPTTTCPAGTLIIDLSASRTPSDAKLSLAPGAFKPSAIDNTLTGWSDTAPAALTITRSIGAATTTVQTGGVNTDDILTRLWDLASYDLNTEYTVTYTFNDNLGNDNTCSFKVKIIDTGAPSITCPGNIVTNSNPTWAAQSTSDNLGASGTVTVTQTTGQASGAVTANSPTQTITLKATDQSNNSATCTFTVTYDTVAPTVTCPPDYAVDQNVDSATGTYTKTSWADIDGAITFSDALSGLGAAASITGDQDGKVYAASTTSEYLVYQPSGGAGFAIGGRTYTRSDLAGNTATCIVRVRVRDVTPPLVTCPPTQNYNASVGSNAYSKSGWAAMFGASDNVVVISSTSLEATRSFGITSGLLGDTAWSVTFSAIDAAGLTSSCTTLVYVQDTQLPSITCPGAMTRPMDSGVKTFTWSTLPWSAPATADNDGVKSLTNNAPLTFPKGATTVTYTVTDHSDNVQTCTVVLTVVDTQNPVLTCPTSSQLHYTESGKSYWTADFFGTVVSNNDNDAINAASRTTNYANGAQMQWSTGSGWITVTYTVADLTGNTDSCSFDVNIVDNQAPSIGCSNKVINTDAGSKYGTYPSAWGFAVTDNADTSLVATDVTYTPGVLSFLRGVNSIHAEVMDEDSNTGSCDFTLTVNQRCGDKYVMGVEECDHQSANSALVGIGCKPDCTCDTANNYVKKSTAGFSCLFKAYKDNIPRAIVGAQVTGGGVAQAIGNNVGTYNVLLDAEPATETYTNITVPQIKTTLGVIFQAGGTRRRMTSGEYVIVKVCPTVNDYTLAAYLFLDESSTGIDAGVHCDSVGATSAPDRFFNGSCYDFAVCGSGLLVIGQSGALDWLQCNDGSSQTATTTSGYTVPVAFNAAGRVTILPSGRTSGAQLKVDSTYGPSYDITSPFSMPPNAAGQSFTMKIKACNATVCSTSCNFDVTVSDGVKPTLDGCSATSSETLTLDALSNSKVYTLPVVYGQDETTFLGSSFTGSATYDYLTTDTTTTPIVPTLNAGASGSTYTPGAATATLKVGTSVFTWTVSDGANNGPTTCVYSITIEDKEPPVLTCPDIAINTGAGSATGTLASTPITVNDNLDPQTVKQATVGGPFTVGQHQIFYATTDAAGNGANCTFTLTVNDNQAPTLNCPSFVNLQTTTASANAAWTVTYNDNDMANTVLTPSIALGTPLDVASAQNVTITVKDKGVYPYGELNKNSVSCTFLVTVQDIQNPTLTCPAPVSINVPGESGVATWAPATITDNDVSPAPQITGSTYSPGASFDVATASYTNTYTGEDYSGRSGTCQFTITTVDTGAPYFSGAAIGGQSPSCPGDQSFNSAAYPNGATGPWYSTPVAVDWRGVTSTTRTAGPAPTDAIETLGLTAKTVTYEASDAAGNKATCTFIVTVVDNQPPVITCPNSATVSAVGSTGSHTFTLDASDDYTAYGSLTWTSTYPAPNPTTKSVTITGLALGANTISYTAKDAATNPSATCTFTVTVNDNTPPEITCPTSILSSVGLATGKLGYDFTKRIAGPGATTTDVTWLPATVTDNAGPDGLTTTYSIDGTGLAAGTHAVTATVKDASNNQATCSFNVKVWEPYQAFSASEAYAAVSRMVLSDPTKSNAWVADVQYVTQVKWPYFLNAPSSLPGAVSDYSEIVGKRNCVRLVSQNNILDGPYEKLASTAYCYQYWQMKVAVGQCDAVTVALTMSHVADCKPADCTYSTASTSINMNVNSGNLCETDLGLVKATANLFVLDDAAATVWLNGAKTADPTSGAGFGDASAVNALVIAKSNEVRFRKVDIFAATRRTYTSSDYSGEPLSTAVLIENGAVKAGSGFTVQAKPDWKSGVDYASFAYTEAALALEQTAYVKLTVTVNVEYELGQATSTRRMLLDMDIDVNDPRRAMLQALPDTGSVGVDAEASLSVSGAGAVGSTKKTSKKTSSAQESFFQTPGGIVVAILFALIFLFFISCGVAYGSYRRGFNKGESQGTASFADFARNQRQSIVNKMKGSAAPAPGSLRHTDDISSSHHSRHGDDDRRDDRHAVEVPQRGGPTPRDFATPPNRGRHLPDSEEGSR